MLSSDIDDKFVVDSQIVPSILNSINVTEDRLPIDNILIQGDMDITSKQFLIKLEICHNETNIIF